MSNRLIMFFISVVCLIFIVSLINSINSLWQKGNLVSDQQSFKDKLAVENQDLKEKLNHIESPDFIERQAREKLNLQREGEIVVVLPKADNAEPQIYMPEPVIPNWQKWWKLFF